LFRIAKGVVQGFFIKLLGADGIAGVAVRESLYHPGLGVLRQKVPLGFLQIVHLFQAEYQLPSAVSVYIHRFHPHLADIGSGSAAHLDRLLARLALLYAAFVYEHFALIINRNFFLIGRVGQYIFKTALSQILFHFSITVQMRLEIHFFTS
jgi:hypothetical protein